MDTRSPAHRHCRCKGESFPLSSRLEDVHPPASMGDRAAEQHAMNLPVDTRRRLHQTGQVAEGAPPRRETTSQRRRHPQGEPRAFAHAEE
jgi:hypothetical protein